MRSTRRGFGRRALFFGLAIFCAITLMSVGFAAWVLSNNANLDSEGGIKTETITDKSVTINITNAVDKVLYDSIDEQGKGVGKQNIAFAPIAPPAVGEANASKHPANVGQIQNDGEGENEDLTFTVMGNVDNIDKIGALRFNVRVPDSLIQAAGLTSSKAEDGTVIWTYDPAKAFIQLPSYAMDMSGKPIPYVSGKLVKAEDSDAVQYVFPTNDDGTVGVITWTDDMPWTADIVWENPGESLANATTSTKIDVTDQAGNTFTIVPMLNDGSIVSGKLEFSWTIQFNWGARYLGMNPNYFYDVDERVVGTHDTLTTAENTPNKYTVDDMNLVNYDLLLMQAVINGYDLENLLAASTVSDTEVYKATGITLTDGQTLEAYVKDTANADTIKESLKVLQENVATAIANLGKGSNPTAPVYGFWVYADVN